MPANFRLLEADDTDWDAFVARVPHDVYHLSGYARVCATHEPHPVRLAVVEDGRDVLLVPVITRPMPAGLPGGEGLCDVTVPYGYPVPVCSSPDERTVRGLVKILWDGLRDLGAVTAFLRWHPFIGVPRDALLPDATFVQHGEHVVVGLEALGPEPLRTFRENHRRNVMALQREGFTVRQDDPTDWAAFPALYRETMDRAGASAYYLFPDAYFTTMRDQLPGAASLVTVVSAHGDVAASLILFTCGVLAQYHLSGTAERYLEKAPVKLAFLRMVELACEQGAAWLNLGSGLGGAHDSLFDFKAGFSSDRAPFDSARVVLDRERFDELSNQVPESGDYFPPYRRGA